jgi:hypothetical protein
MPLTRWAAMALVVPALAALGIACDRTTPTENRRPGAADAAATFDRDDDGDDDNGRLRAVPFVFVGTATQCGGVAGTPIVTAAWLGGIGLPDNGGQNTAEKGDPHLGLLLNKNGPTPDCSSSGARILGVRGMVVDADFALGYDNRNGGHCGGGAPRFNVAYQLPNGASGFSFVGACNNETTPPGGTPAPQDGEWTRYRFEAINGAESFPPIPIGSRIESITILFDEGTDTPTLVSQNAGGIGLTTIDNIFIDGRYIRRGTGIATDRGDRDDDRGDNDRDRDG